MPTNDLVRAALDLAWSHWVGLGVRGTALPPQTAVDPEALLYFTFGIMDEDPRLRDEVVDWYRQFGHHLSAPRLNSLGRQVGSLTLAGFEAHVQLAKKSTGKSELTHLATPARALLRLRCAFGANARAEIILELLAQDDRGRGLTALALSELGYSKRNVALVLNDLVLAGVVTSISEGNRAQFRLAHADALRAAFGPIPKAAQWHIRLPIIARFVELALRVDRKDAMVQSVEAHKTFEQLRNRLDLLELPPLPTSIGETHWATLQEWLIAHVIRGPRAESDRIDGMLEGAWVRKGQTDRRPAGVGSAVLPRRARSETMTCLDLVQVPTISPPNGWAWAVLSVAATNVYSHTIGLDRGEAWQFVVWDGDKATIYDVEYDDPIHPEKIAIAYGTDAAARARADQPAVQLKLRRAPSTER